MMNNPADISTARWGDVSKSSSYDIAILPWGTTEPHNGHLPYGTDFILSREIALLAAEAAGKKGIKAAVLPAVPFGSQNPGQTSLPFCLHASQATQFSILTDIVRALVRSGIDKLLIINGHGGNSFKGMIRDLAVDYPDFLIAESEWYKVLPRKGYFDAEVDDHAGEQETSVMLFFHPEFVDMSLAGDGDAKRFALDALNEGVAWIPRNWCKVTSDTGVGNPKAATAEKGGRYVAAIIERYVGLLDGLVSGKIY